MESSQKEADYVLKEIAKLEPQSSKVISILFYYIYI